MYNKSKTISVRSSNRSAAFGNERRAGDRRQVSPGTPQRALSLARQRGLADRVIYVKDRWVDSNAKDEVDRDLAVCQPGPVARLLVKSVKQPIHGKLAQRTLASSAG